MSAGILDGESRLAVYGMIQVSHRSIGWLWLSFSRQCSPWSLTRTIFRRARNHSRDIAPHLTMASLASASAVTLGAFPKTSGLRRSEVRELPNSSRSEHEKNE